MHRIAELHFDCISPQCSTLLLVQRSYNNNNKIGPSELVPLSLKVNFVFKNSKKRHEKHAHARAHTHTHTL